MQIKEVLWPGDACIICLNAGELSLEHVIPDALHGTLTSKFLPDYPDISADLKVWRG